MSVPPAHVGIIEAGRAGDARHAGHVGHVRWEPFWSPPSGQRLRYRRDADYEEHFRMLFRDAVRARLRTDRPAWAFLSGGLDSSSIVCVADDLIAAGDAQARILHTITYVYDPSPATGERSFTMEVDRRRGQGSHYLDLAEYPYLRPRPAEGPPVPYLLDASVGLVDAQKALMGRLGGHVVLSGSGGDEMLGNSRRGDLVAADLLRHGEFRAFGRALKQWSVSLRRPAIALLWQALAAVPSRRARPFSTGNPPWLDPAFVDLVAEPASVARMRAHQTWPSGLHSVVARTAQQDYGSWCGCEVRYPFLDRRLVEFCLSIPLDQLTRPGETRSLMRRALRGIVCERILTRRSKNAPARPIGAAVEREWQRLSQLFSRPLVEQYGLASGSALKEALRRARHGTERFLGLLVITIVLEEWLRQATAQRWLLSPGMSCGYSRRKGGEQE
jgi:asparagine synthase (glutamine-hydrolysing)